MIAALLLLFSFNALAADPSADLLAAARKGQTARVESLAATGASLESTDKDGRTPLMLAAQHGHAETVRALAARGAMPDVRDKQGWTAWGLAFFSSAGGREEVLKALPRPATVRLVIKPELGIGNLHNSCLLTLPKLIEQVRAMRPEARVVAAIREAAAAAPVKPPVELVAEGGDAVLTLRVRPQVGCVAQQSADNLNLEADVRVAMNGEASPLLEKTFGGGFKGLGEHIVTSLAQYPPVYDEWARKQGPAIYWAAVEALLRHPDAAAAPKSPQ
jgi:hypothetical protein